MPAFVEKLMSTGEEVRLTRHRHWITLVGAAVIYGILFLLMAFVSGLALGGTGTGTQVVGAGAGLGAIVFLALFGVTILQWYYRLFVVTTRRVIQIGGVLNRRVSDTNLDKVNDVLMTQSVLGRLLNYGTIEIISGSDVGVDSFNRITDPVGFKRAMLDNKEDFDTLVRAATETSRPSTATQIEELASLRDRGLISSEEYEAKRAELVERL